MSNKATNFRGPVRVGPQVAPMAQGLSAGNLNLQRGDVVLTKIVPISASWGGATVTAGNAGRGSSVDLNIAPCRIIDAYMILNSAWACSTGASWTAYLGTSAAPTAIAKCGMGYAVAAGATEGGPLSGKAGRHVLTPVADFAAGCEVLASGTQCVFRITASPDGSALRTVSEGKFVVQYVIADDL